MENRRPTDKPFAPKRFQDKNNQSSAPRYAPSPNREGGGFQNREGRSNYVPRSGADNREIRDNRDNRDNRSRDTGTGSGQSNFRQAPGKFVPRGGANTGSRFSPRGKFPPGGKNVKPWKKEEIIKIVSPDQITDGKHKGKYLINNVSPKARRTDQRLRESMLRILSRRVRAGRFLDLCAGSGTVGIEAISRGSIVSTFVERSAKMCSFIKKNLEALSIKTGHGEVFEEEAVPFLKSMSKRRRYWDVVYLDPPTEADFEEIFALLSRGATIKEKGILVVEHGAQVFLPEKSGVLKRWRVVVQGERAMSFFERK